MKLVLPFPPTVKHYYRAPNKEAVKGKHPISEQGRKYKKVVYARW
jgi:crossover junction endodeoxyribonuclease RusA